MLDKNLLLALHEAIIYTIISQKHKRDGMTVLNINYIPKLIHLKTVINIHFKFKR